MSRWRVKKITWGILFLLGALVLLLGKMGYLDGLGFWSVFFSVILLGILIEGILKRSFGEILFPLAGLIIINDDLLRLEAITPWPVLGAALLGTIGLNFIFPGKKKWQIHKNSHYLPEMFQSEEGSKEILSGENIRYEVSMGNAIKYITGQNIDLVRLECSFGNLEVYFNNAVLKDNRANASVECSFGNIEIYVPADWNVDMDIDSSFGGVEESGSGDPGSKNTLYVKGDVSFGHIMIHHV